MTKPLLVKAGSEGCEAFGFLLQFYRSANDFTRKELADKAGVSSEFIRSIEMGRRAPARRTAFEILSHMQEQGWITWRMSDPEYDLCMVDPTKSEWVKFKFHFMSGGRGSTDHPKPEGLHARICKLTPLEQERVHGYIDAIVEQRKGG